MRDEQEPTAASPETGVSAPGYSLDASAGHMLRRAHQRYQSMFQECAAGLGLTGPQFAALLRLSEMGRVTQNHLGRLAAMDSATVQGVVRRLVDRGLVQAEADRQDRRTRILTITEAGAELLRAAQEAGRRANDSVLAPLSAAERRQLLSMLRRVAEG
ncbi:MarR family winged helix-turn-helix transcriptional regulator [Roseococcus thiosulfatophilus]|uniref:MarR family winged helix-turn-helix transcriptional regulator n=1 Tax=Roseococcus thiosulfatophilus TaxID=35813 RepID=UPI001A90525D|nr:MarR family transcriptional regulator [Roseococcus thiosulfatophilus]